MTKITVALFVIFLNGCDNQQSPKPAPTTPEVIQKTPTNLSLDKDITEIQKEIESYLKSGKEPSIKDAHWFTKTHLVVAMNDKGGSYDGWAETICLIASDHGLVTKGSTIEVIDYIPMLKQNFKSLGRHYCVSDGSPPTVVKF